MSKEEQVGLIENQQQRQIFKYKEEDPAYEGQPLDERIRQGPLNDRGCKDIFFVFLYLTQWILLLVIAYYAYQNGNPNLLLSPFDIYGNHCGYNVTKDYKEVYIQDHNEYYCVTSCPSEDNQLLNCYNCSVKAKYASKQILTLCYPLDDQYEDIIADMVDLKGSEKFFSDLKTTWPAIASSAILALIFSLLLTFLIKWITKYIVWSMIIIYLVLVAFIGTFAYLQAKTDDFSQYKYIKDNTLLLTLAFSLWGIAALSMLLVICLYKKIVLAIAVLKAAADFTRDVFQVILVPICVFIFILGFFAFWLVVSIYIYSAGNITKSNDGPFFALDWDVKSQYSLLFYLFGLFWNCEFAIALCQFIVSSAACMWYYSHMGVSLDSPICKSLYRGLFNHLGSLLFGSLILAVVQMIKFLLNQIHIAMKSTLLNSGGGDNAIMNCGLTYCKCLVRYFETFIRFLNTNAYIMIALTGQSFCSAAYDAFYLITRNIMKVAITQGCIFYTQISGFFITAATSSLCYLIITQADYFSDKLISPIAPTIAFIIISYVVGSLFMNLYGIGTDSILLCYLADHELNKNQGGAKSMPGSLKEFLHEYE